jgi:hypothetical protein
MCTRRVLQFATKNLKQECEKLTSPQHEQCLSDLDERSYDEYRRERNEVLRENFVGR